LTTIPPGQGDSANSPPPSRVRLAVPINKRPGPRDIEDQNRANEAAKGSLDLVRKTAENWRTGIAGLITLVTGTLLFKGQDSINGYEGWVHAALGTLVGLSLAVGVISLLLFLNAAYGKPKVLTTQEIADTGGIDAYHLRLAQVALDDLKWARRWGIVSATLLALAITLAWYGPSGSSDAAAFAKITYTEVAGGTAKEVRCGVLQVANSKDIRLQVSGEQATISIDPAQLLSIVIVSKC
jgi:hypothetical protein